MYSVHVTGERACFPRVECRHDLVSYDVMPPSAARALLSSIYWKPAIRWHVHRLRVLNPVRWQWIDRSPGADAAGVQLPLVVLLTDVAYVIEADFVLTDKAGAADTVDAHRQMFERRCRKSGYFRRPYFGIRECPAAFRLLDVNDTDPTSDPIWSERSVDLGWLPLDDGPAGGGPRFFRAIAQHGMIEVPDPDDALVVR